MKFNSKISKEIKKQIFADKDKLSAHEISKKYNVPIFEVKKIINASAKKTPKWFYAILFFLPILFLILLEILLRNINYGYDFTQWIDAGEGKYVINSNISKKYFTSGDFNPTTSEDYFDIQKKTNSFRVFVLGGSSAEGYPYSPMGSFSRYVRKRLELVYPNTHIEVVNLGMTAVNSYTILDLFPEVLDQQPDLILIYAGHNEYYGALGVGSVQSFGSSRNLINLILYLNNFKTTQLVRNSIQWVTSLFFSSENIKSSGTLMSQMANDKNIILDSDVYNAGLQQFKENFTDILTLCKEKGVPVIIGKLASNLKDQKPFISVATQGYKNTDKVYEEAWDNFKNDNFKKADSLFRLAKDLDALRFRAPSKMNMIIDQLGKEFNVATVPIDSIFNSESSGGIVGDNLIVDHLHPNVEGYQLIGKAFYNCMEKKGYLPKTENANIPFAKQDSLTKANFVFTKLDSAIGNYNITLLKHNWPYVKNSITMTKFQHKDFLNMLQPKDLTDSIAVYKIEGLSWTDAHLLAAKTYLRRDDIKNYLKHINTILYQYPVLKDFNTLITYFYNQKKIDLADYTSTRVGIIELYREKYDEAIKHLTKTYNIDPKNSFVLYNLSVAYFEKRDLKSALSMINKCLDVDKKNEDAIKLKREILNQLEKTN
ncbi:MAG: tetratricopeptide repeat protein [Ignavibacteriae bacterium]|nr:tetratricopeptide repeat protein [Ignavibacteriota bacterium]